MNMINDERYKLGRFIIKVDHHISNCNYGDLNIVDTSEISCASLLAKIIFSNNMKLTSHGARALFTGIVTDSGRFRYSSTSSNTYLVASELAKYNLNTDYIYNNLYVEKLENVKLINKIKIINIETNQEIIIDSSIIIPLSVFTIRISSIFGSFSLVTTQVLIGIFFIIDFLLLEFESLF